MKEQHVVTPATGDARTMTIKDTGIPGQWEDHQGQQQLWSGVCLACVFCAYAWQSREVELPRPVGAQKMEQGPDARR